MKKIILMTFVVAFLFAACKEESLGISTLINYPTITPNGDVALTIPVGGSYTESGCTVKEGDLDLSHLSDLISISGAVNPAIAGVYTITYTYKSADKYNSKDSTTITARRYVGVITSAASAMNLSGSYKRNASPFGVATIEKTSFPGLYINNNPGGIATTNIYVYMFHTDVKVVSVPSQNSSVGEFACTEGIYDATGAAPLYKWKCISSGYATTVRTFNKQ